MGKSRKRSRRHGAARGRWWSVLVETRETVSRKGDRVDIAGEAASAFADELWWRHSGSACVGPNSWSGRIAVKSKSPGGAIVQALDIVTAAGRRAGLPEYQVSHVEALRWDVFERSLSSEPPPQPQPVPEP